MALRSSTDGEMTGATAPQWDRTQTAGPFPFSVDSDAENVCVIYSGLI